MNESIGTINVTYEICLFSNLKMLWKIKAITDANQRGRGGGEIENFSNLKKNSKLMSLYK